MKRQNEVNAMEALLRIMPFVTGMTYQYDRSPDDEASQQKEVDYLLKNRDQRQPSLAVEHTIVEAFRGQITCINRSFDIVAKVAELCKGKLPSDRYYILVVPDALVDALRKRAIQRFVDAIVPWVLSTAPALRIDDYKNLVYKNERVLLICHGSHPDINGTIGRIPRRPDDQEDRAIQSLWIAFKHGFGKFSKYKDSQYDTVLCLQDVSGEIHPSALLELNNDPIKKGLIARLVDYVVVFASVDDRMIKGRLHLTSRCSCPLRGRPGCGLNSEFHAMLG